MKTESGSVRIERPTRKLPAASHVQAVEISARSGCRPSMEQKVTIAAANEPAHGERRDPAGGAPRSMPAVPSGTVIGAAARALGD